MNQFELFWGIAIIVFAVLEALTAGLVSIWFAAGSLGALIAAFLGAKLWLQCILFIVISLVCFIFVRSHAAKSIKSNPEKTDIDRIIGTKIIITETVDNQAHSGRAEINDVEWKVKSSNGEIINSGEVAVVEKIEGVRLVVKSQK